MNKSILILPCFMFSSLLSLAANSFSADDKWIDEAVSYKQVLRNKMEQAKMPVSSQLVTSKQGAVKMTADLTNQNQLVLIANSGAEGGKKDWAVWGNAKLYKADGSFVWLDQLKPSFSRSKRAITKNKSIKGGAIKIAKQTYRRGVVNAAPSIMVFDLKEPFVRFEAEVGIDDASNKGSVVFTITNANPTEFAKNLYQQYPYEIGRLRASVDNLENWLINTDASSERKAAEGSLKRLTNKAYFEAEFNKIAKLQEVTDQVEAYLALHHEMGEVLSLQDELQWLDIEAVQLAMQDMQKMSGYPKEENKARFNALKALVSKGFDAIYRNDKQAMANAAQALELKKEILLDNPLLNGDKIVAAKYVIGANARHANAPDLGTQSNNWSNQESARRSGFNAQIVELSNLRGDSIEQRTVFHQKNGGSIADLKMHWDGDRVMFTSTQDDKRWNIYESQLETGEVKPMLPIPERDLEFYDGTYLPDGRVIAISNIGYQGVPCVSGSDPVGNMVLFNPGEESYRRITYDQDANWNPVIMNNGRVMYTRWEYTDLMHYYSRFVMHMNPDGTEQKALYGSGETFPNSTFDIQPLPGHASAFVGIISGHHGVARAGRLIVFDPTKGRAGVDGMLQEIPYRERKIEKVVKDYLVNGVWPQFIKPTPVNDKYFLVAAKLHPRDLWGIYLVDVYNNMTCLMKEEGEGYISPILVRKVNTPPTIPDRVNLDSKEATVFIQDIYEGEGLRGVPRGTIKSLRLHAYEYAYLKTRSDHNWQGIQSGWDIKRQLGTVPVEEDGSAIFKIPANTPISIQPLDEQGRAVQLMRSWLTGMPGEVVSCVGCHEDQNQIAMPKRVIASQRQPHTIKAPEGGVRSFTFDLEVQPVLDRACVACHDGSKAFDLRGGKKDKLGYGTAYLNLHPYVHRQGPEADMAVLQPYEYHASTSELVRLLEKGHHNVKLTPEEWQQIYTWIDYNAPDRGSFEANEVKNVVNQGGCQIKRRIELTNKYGNGMGVDWKQEIADYASFLEGKGEITPEMPEPMKAKKMKQKKAKEWPFNKDMVVEMLAEESQTRKTVEIAPGVKINFVRIPAGQFVMGSLKGDADNKPVSKVKIDKAFWMADVEITNEQYAVFFPEHDSRYVDQLWKDHVHEGYLANLPEQPVIRVSYDDAMAFCEKLSKATNLNITLPTEAQWEWACRAGSEEDFWFGDLNADFSEKENFADKQTLKFAVQGVDPQPMSEKGFWYKHYTYLPKEANVDDKAMIQVDSKNYQANPFGLHSMHGNIAEWTRSHYLPYPYKAKSKDESPYRVVRGGSYIERPKFSTAYSRKYYYPHQRVHNVGFRIIIED